MHRREFARLALLAPFAPAALAAAGETQSRHRAEAAAHRAHAALAAQDGMTMMGGEKIAMLLYPGFTALDLVGPQYFFESMMGAEIYLISSRDGLEPVMSDTGLAVVPTHTQAQCPAGLDLLFLPGGSAGTARAMRDAAFIGFIRERAASAKRLASVCTGSLLLGKAGLLRGKKATSHWIALDLLARFGAVAVKERVVWDGELVTAAGVTAGLDLALQIAAALRGPAYAAMLQLQAEYDPAPPHGAGSPDKADPALVGQVKDLFEILHTDLALAI